MRSYRSKLPSTSAVLTRVGWLGLMILPVACQGDKPAYRAVTSSVVEPTLTTPRRATVAVPTRVPTEFPAANVGTLDGAFTVRSDGQLHYAVPLSILPGRNGAQPSLSLEYESNGANGLAGVGWSLRGLSAIEVCASNIADHGRAGGRALCLDGASLVKTDDTVDQTEPVYRTIPDDGRRIRRIRQSNGSEDCFEVDDTNGGTTWYGCTENSRWEALGRNERPGGQYALNQYRDRFGNSWTVDYLRLRDPREETESDVPVRFDANGPIVGPRSIVYTHPDATKRIDFVYEDRPDVGVLSIGAGVSLRLDKRLSRIRVRSAVQVSGEAPMFTEYRLAYATPSQSGMSRLESLRECSVLPHGDLFDDKVLMTTVDCRPPSRFDWQVAQQGFGEARLPNFAFLSADPAEHCQGPTVADINRDGRDDVVYAGACDTGAIHIVYGGPNGNFTADTIAGVPAQPFWLLDHDGNGRLSIVVKNEAEDGWAFYERNPSGQWVVVGSELVRDAGGSIEHYLVADVDRDGLGDIVACETTNATWTAPGPDHFGFDPPSWAGDEISIERQWVVHLARPGKPMERQRVQVEQRYPASASFEYAREWDSYPKDWFGPLRCHPGRVAVNATRGKWGPAIFGEAAAWLVDINEVSEQELPSGPMPFELGYTPAGVFARVFPLEHQAKPALEHLEHRLWIDVAGDGLLDWISWRDDHAVLTNAQDIDGVHRRAVPMFGSENELHRAVVLDYDRDGDDDILIPPSTGHTWRLARWNEADEEQGFVVTSVQLDGSSFANAKHGPVVVGDFDGDAVPDLVRWRADPASPLPWALVWQPGAFATYQKKETRGGYDRIRAFTDGLGAITSVEYWSMASGVPPDHPGSTFWDGAEACAYPHYCVRDSRPLVVATSVTTGDSTPRRETTYSYANLRLDRWSGRTLGFDRVYSWAGKGTDRPHFRVVVHDQTPPTYASSRGGSTHALGYRGTPFGGRPAEILDVVKEPAGRAYVTKEVIRWDLHKGSGTASASVCVPGPCVASDYQPPQPVVFAYPATRTLTHWEVEGTAPDSPSASVSDEHRISELATGITVDEFGGTVYELAVLSDSTAGTSEVWQRDTELRGTVDGIPTLDDGWRRWVTSDALTHTAPGGEARTHRTAYDLEGWYGTNERLRITEQPGSTLEQLVTEIELGESGVTRIRSTAVEAEAREVLFAYDPTERTYVSRVTQPGIDVRTTTWNPRLAVPAIVRDGYGVERHFGWDTLGRLRRVQTFGRDDSGVATRVENNWVEIALERMDAAQDATQPSRIRTRVALGQGGEIISRDDVRGRRVYREWDGMNERVYERWEYDAHGRLARHTRPQTLGQAPIADTQYAYDGVGRMVWRKWAPDAQELFVHAKNEQIHVDAAGKLRYARSDAGGRLLEIKDHLQTRFCYEYGAFGHPRRLIKGCDPSDPLKVVTYQTDTRGNVTLLDEPGGAGKRERIINAFGELVQTRDGNGEVTIYRHDAAGRLYERIDTDGTTEWSFHPLTTDDLGSTGQPIPPGALTRSEGPDGHARKYEYDDFGRLEREEVEIAGQAMSTGYSYDGAGRLQRVAYPRLPGSSSLANLTVEYVYDGAGQLRELRDHDREDLIWRIEDTNPDGQLAIGEYGNGLHSVRDYDPHTGRLEDIVTAVNPTTLASPVQRQHFRYYPVGSLDTREDAITGVRERFLYDDLHRLVTVQLGQIGTHAQTTVDIGGYNYDAFGNIRLHSVWGVLSSTPAGRLLSINGTANITYDDNGQLLSDGSRQLAWTPFGKPRTVSRGTASYHLEYDADQRRVLRMDQDGVATYSVSGLYQAEEHPRDDGGRQLIHRLYVGARGETVAIREVTSTYPAPTTPPRDEDPKKPTRGTGTKGPDLSPLPERATHDARWLYVHADQLGTPTVITDESRAVVARYSYDAWGNLRASNWVEQLNAQGPGGWADPGSDDTRPDLNLGFTGHSTARDAGLVDMGGRLYDPRLGRFVSADPFVIEGLTQGHNRYSYVLNNPTTLTDPTGLIPAAWCDKWSPRCEGVPPPGAEGDVGGVSIWSSASTGSYQEPTVGPNPYITGHDTNVTAKAYQPPPSSELQFGTVSTGGDAGELSFVHLLAQRAFAGSTGTINIDALLDVAAYVVDLHVAALGEAADFVDEWMPSDRTLQQIEALEIAMLCSGWPPGMIGGGVLLVAGRAVQWIRAARRVEKAIAEVPDVQRILSRAGSGADAQRIISRAATGADELAESVSRAADITADEIRQINRSFGGTTELTGNAETVIANMSYRDHVTAKAATAIRDIAGRHLFDDGNKRTAQAVAERILGSSASPRRIRSVVDQVATGKLRDVDDITAALGR